MKGLAYFAVFVLLVDVGLHAQTFNIFLLGDAGEPYVKDSPIGKVLREKVIEAGDENSLVLFLGDNIYPGGLPDNTAKGFAEAEAILRTQIEWTKGLATKAIFIPGNHDWNHWGKLGLQYALNQQEAILSLEDDRISFQPRDGCPGPFEIQLDNNAVLIVLNSQWFLHKWEKPGEKGSCDAKSEAIFFSQIESMMKRNAGKKMIVAAHHPLVSYGVHGGVYTLKEHIFPLTALKPRLYLPLPVAGSLYPAYRKVFPNIQDIGHPIYKRFSEKMHSILRSYPGSVYVSGHEHSLQHIVKDSVYYVVSGSAAKKESVKKKKYAKYANAVRGFVQISIDQDKPLLFRYWQVDKRSPEGKEIFTTR